MSGEVRKLHTDVGLPDAPALGFSLQFDLGSGRVATTQTFLPNDCTLAELNAMFDKMTAAGDRQRAKYKIEELERDLDKTEREQAQHKDDLARIDEEYDAAQAKRHDEIQKAQSAVDSFNAKARDAHVASGRRGEYRPGSGDRSRLATTETGIINLKADIDKAEAEHAVAHTNSEMTFKRREEIAGRLRDEIARCRDIVARKE